MLVHRCFANNAAQSWWGCSVALVLPFLVSASVAAQTPISVPHGDPTETFAQPSEQVVSVAPMATANPMPDRSVPNDVSPGREGPNPIESNAPEVSASVSATSVANATREAPNPREGNAEHAKRAESPDKAQPNWSVGAGLTFSSLGQSTDAAVMSNSAYLGMTTIVPAVSPVAFLEYRVASGLFLFVQPEGYYTQNKFENEAKTRYFAGHSIGPGLRWVANPSGLVEFGMSHLVYVAATYSRMPSMLNQSGAIASNGEPVWAAPTTQSLGTASAFVAERMLLPQLWVRVAATFFRAYLAKTTMTYETEQGERSRGYSSGASIRLGFEPAITLRLAF